MNGSDVVFAFQRQALARLAKRPALPPDLHDFQVLVVCLGPPQPEDMLEFRASLNPATSLLWVYAPVSEVAEQEIEQAAEASDKCILTAAVDVTGSFFEKTQFLVELLDDKRVQLLRHQKLEPTFNDISAKLDRAIRNAVETLNQNHERGLIRLRSSIRNLPSIWRNAANRLMPLPRAVPALVCGAGPSLAAQLEELKPLADRVVIIATGHALPAMMRAGIQPDLVVSDDSRVWWKMPEGIDPKIPLVACAELAATVADKFPNVLWCKGSSMPFSITLQKIGLDLQPAELRKTVTIHAMDVARRLGCGRIILIGQDLSIADDGTLHAEGGKSPAGDELIEVPGNEGKIVLTNNDLAGLLDAIEEYIAELPLAEDGSPLVANATTGGALIRGAARLTLAQLLLNSPPMNSRPLLIAPIGQNAPDAANLNAICDELEAFKGNALETLEASRLLQRELDRYPLRMPAVRKAQQALQTGVRREADLLTSAVAGPWMSFIVKNTDRLCGETPGLVTNSDNPATQLVFLQYRYTLLADLVKDVLAIFKPAVESLTKAVDVFIPSPVMFNSFRNLGLRTIRQSNPEAAELLADRSDWPISNRFSIRFVYQKHQHISMLQPDGVWQPLSALFSMIDEARSDVTRAVAESGFDPQKHALTILAPCNWLHMATWSKLFPRMDIVVIEPWPDLLSTLMDAGCFLHLLPSNSLVLCVGSQFTAWQKLYAERMQKRAEAGRKSILFIPPVVAGFSEVKNLQDIVFSLQ